MMTRRNTGLHSLEGTNFSSNRDETTLLHNELENFDEEESLQDKTELDSDNVEKISFSFLSGIDSTNYKYQHRNSRTS